MTHFWKITPSAGSEDSRWLDWPRYREVVVAAPTPAEARHVAARYLAQRPDPVGVGNESAHLESALEDEKLYRVTRLADDETVLLAPGRERAVLSVRA